MVTFIHLICFPAKKWCGKVPEGDASFAGHVGCEHMHAAGRGPNTGIRLAGPQRKGTEGGQELLICLPGRRLVPNALWPID